VKTTPAVLPSDPVQRGAALLEPNLLQSGESVATAGAAEENLELVADESAAEAGKDGRGGWRVNWATDEAGGAIKSRLESGISRSFGSRRPPGWPYPGLPDTLGLV
jgi:hypothetical protein